MLMNMLKKEKDEAVKETIVNHLFTVVQSKEQQDLAKEWLK